MGKKYIIELEEKPFHKNGDFLYRVKGFNSLVFDMTGVGKLTPYTDPDMEQVRKEAYENGYENGFIAGHLKAEKSGQSFYEDGYKRGLADAWDAARKIASDNAGQNYSIFGQHFTTEILNIHSASEAIEEIRAYEQAQKEKEEQGQKDSFIVENVMRQYLDTFCTHRKSCTECPLNISDFTCGRGYYFLGKNLVSDEEVRRAYATVLAKMKENHDNK